MIVDDLILRRIRFMLQEAALCPERDQVITYAMRVVSNYSSVGKDAQSAEVTKLNTRISTNALNSMSDYSSFADWVKTVTNDHPEPLRQTWDWLIANSKNLTETDVWNRFCSYPMITITRVENKNIDGKGFRSKGSPMERYLAAGIKIVQLNNSIYNEWNIRRVGLKD